MAILRVRKLEPEVISALENRARRNGHSLEEEAYEIIRTALEKEDRELAATQLGPRLPAS
jgi:plasmid stability protein